MASNNPVMNMNPPMPPGGQPRPASSKKGVIIIAIVAAVVLIAASLMIYFWVIKPRREATAALKNVPKDSFAVIEVHMKQAMEFGPLKNAMSLPEVQEGLGKFKEKCGFDPTQKIDDLYIAVRAVQNKPQIGFVVRGSFTQAEIQNCIAKLNDGKDDLIPGAPLNGHPTYTSTPKTDEAEQNEMAVGAPPPRRRRSNPFEDGLTVAVGNGLIAAAVPAWIGDVVKVADGQGEGADQNENLFAARKILRGGPALAILFDAKNFQTGMPEVWSGALKGMRNPMVSGLLGRVANITAGGLSLSVDGDKLKYLAFAKFGSRDDAKEVASTLSSLMGLGKAALGGQMTRQQQRTQDKIDRLSATKPELKPKMQPAVLMFPVLSKILAALEFKQDGDTVRMELELTSSEVNNLIEGLKADKVIKDTERASWELPTSGSNNQPAVPMPE